MSEDKNIKDTAKIKTSSDNERFKKYNEELSKKQSEEAVLESKKNIRILIITASLILIIFLAFIISKAFRRPYISLNDYIDIKIDGYDKYGEAYITFNEDEFYKDNLDELKNYIKKDSDVKAEDFIKSYVKVDLSKKEKLSNGDIVSLEWDVDKKEIDDNYKIDLSFKKEDIKVDSLKIPQTFDPFENIEIDFTGISGEGNINIIKDEDIVSPLKDIEFTTKDDGSLYNGQEIVIKASYNYEGEDRDYYFVNTYGYIPERDSIEVTVSGLNEYIISYDQLDEGNLEILLMQGEDIFKKYMSSNWDKNQELVNIDYIGNYFLVPKEYDSEIEYYNKIFLIYKIDEKMEYDSWGNEGEDSTEYYWFVEFRNFVLDENGKIKFDLKDYSTPEVSFNKGIILSPYYRRLEGYMDFDNLKNYIAKDAIDYNIVENIDYSIFEEEISPIN